VINLSWERIDFCSAVIYEQNRPTHQHGLQREFTNSSRCRCSSGRTNSRMVVLGSDSRNGLLGSEREHSHFDRETMSTNKIGLNPKVRHS
jgi:hypothetical protein